jgi:ADP-ribose pyrophosphatase
MTKPPEIASREAVVTTPYFRLLAKRLKEPAGGEPYYSLEMLDYVSVVAIARDGRFILVRQYRPAVETVTLELPAGHVELAQQPEQAARTELAEETGHLATEMRFAGSLRPDTGRLANKMWVYVATGLDPILGWQPEAGVEVITASADELTRWLNDGTFDHALHVAALYMAMRAGHVTL